MDMTCQRAIEFWKAITTVLKINSKTIQKYSSFYSTLKTPRASKSFKKKPKTKNAREKIIQFVGFGA